LPEDTRILLALYALTLMHGSGILLENSGRARLFAGFASRQRRLEVKVEIAFHELSKPLMAPICLFLTDLAPEAHCAPELLEPSEPSLPTHWDTKVERRETPTEKAHGESQRGTATACRLRRPSDGPHLR
jgi:hypothetical protein